MAEEEDSIGIERIGHVPAGKGTGQIIVVMTRTGNIVVDCNIVEGCIAALWIQGEFAVDLAAAAVEEAGEYRKAAQDALSSFRYSY